MSAAEKNLLNAFYSICNLAVAGNASYIITNNIRDLATAELKFPELQIITPAIFLRGN